MIRSLIQAATSFLLAAREERLALADLHRANAKKTEIVHVGMPSFTKTEAAPVFVSCPDRAAMAFVETLLVEEVPCEAHGVEAGTPCPSEDVPLGTSGGAKMHFPSPPLDH